MTDEVQSILAQAEQLKRVDRHLDAIKVCEQALALDLNCVEAYEEIGDNYISLQELAKAEKALNRALALDSDSANACYLMGFLCSARRDWQRSAEYLERANGAKSNHPEVLRCLGWSIFMSGDHSRGIILLERARSLAPNDIYVLTDLGVCYLNEKNIIKALEIFRHVLNLDPGNLKARECLLIVEEYATQTRKLGKK